MNWTFILALLGTGLGALACYLCFDIIAYLAERDGMADERWREDRR